jgi:dihydrofolate reductase
MKVVLLMAMTVDGKIAKDQHHFPDWTSSEDKRMFKAVTQKAGVLIMGSKTYDAIGRPLPDRKNIVLTRKKERWCDQGNLVFTGESPKALLSNLTKEGYSTVILAGGAKINYLFAVENLIDEIHVTFSPVIFGTGLSLIGGQVSMILELIDFKALNRHEIFARYRVVK